MAFDVDRLVEFCVAELRRFAAEHHDETFYAFAIDASLLCLNSEQAFSRAQKEYEDDWARRTRPLARWEDVTEDDLRDAEYMLGLCERLDGLDRSDHVACLAAMNQSRTQRRADEANWLARSRAEMRSNPGDWAYQGFAEMTEAAGFDNAAYQLHYGLSDADQTTSAYGLAMDEVVRRLSARGDFRCLKTVPGFYATRVEHGY